MLIGWDRTFFGNIGGFVPKQLMHHFNRVFGQSWSSKVTSRAVMLPIEPLYCVYQSASIMALKRVQAIYIKLNWMRWNHFI